MCNLINDPGGHVGSFCTLIEMGNQLDIRSEIEKKENKFRETVMKEIVIGSREQWSMTTAAEA